MNRISNPAKDKLLGIGLYTPAEAQRLLKIPAARITRWLRGHTANGVHYDPLWVSQVDLGDGKTYLGFRDLMELKTAHAFMEEGVSAIMIRRAIEEARKVIDDEHPLSTTAFKTDGRSIFFEIADATGENDPKLLDLFKKQFVFKKIIETSLRGVDFEGISPARWWPLSRDQKVVVDPQRSFGQPIEAQSGVPTAALAAAADAEGSIEQAAAIWRVPPSAIRRAIEFEGTLKAAA